MWWDFAIISGFLFALGAVLGSFLNVVIYRTVTDEDWVNGRSHCEHCRKRIAWFDNIPVLSYLFLRGRCRNCQKMISLSHPVVEFLTGALFVWWYWAGTWFFQLTQTPFTTLQPLFWLMVGILLLGIFFADLLYYIIPDVMVGTLMALTILYRLLLTILGQMQVHDLLLAVMGMILFVGLLGALWLVTKGKGMGFGDVKLAAPIALLVGWPNVIILIMVAFLTGASVGVILLLLGKKKLGQVVPFGPFLVIATFVTLVAGDKIMQAYMQFLTR